MARSTRQRDQSPWHIIRQVIQFYRNNADVQHQRAVGVGLLLLVLLSILVGTALVFESIQRGEFISALAARDTQRFQIAVTKLIGVLLLSAALLSFSAYVRDKLGLKWREGLSRSVLDAYLENRNYYHLPAEIDNPDQRISEDIKNVSQVAVVVLAIFLESGVQLVGFVGVLLSISFSLTGFLLVYALVGSAIATLVFGIRLTRINAEQLKREANFRFNLINVRENAESIAFYNAQDSDQDKSQSGVESDRQNNENVHQDSVPQKAVRHNPERAISGQRFEQVVQNFNRFIRWQLGLDCFQNGYQYLTFILPSLILAPRILAGDLEVGAIVQSQAAFDRIWLSLSLVIVQFEQLTVLAASTNRLQKLLQSIQSRNQSSLTAIEAATEPTIKVVEQPQLTIKNLTLKTPGEKRILSEDLSLSVTESLLITGASGVGKSSLVKAIAGLWQSGQGTIGYPQKNTLFLPQQPYMTVGTLREQLLYPNSHRPPLQNTESALLTSLLKQVQLANLTQLDQVEDWAGQLSTGEQQRLAFARLLLHQPAYVILDEATSALSIQQEKDLYQQLEKTNTLFITIGHRPSLFAYHSQVLTLANDCSWTLQKQVLR